MNFIIYIFIYNFLLVQSAQSVQYQPLNIRYGLFYFATNCTYCT